MSFLKVIMSDLFDFMMLQELVIDFFLMINIGFVLEIDHVPIVICAEDFLILVCLCGPQISVDRVVIVNVAVEGNACGRAGSLFFDGLIFVDVVVSGPVVGLVVVVLFM